MGVGDYVHSKEAIQLRPSVKEQAHRTRQQLADQARFDITPATMGAPAPMPVNRHLQRDNYGAASFEDPPHSEAETIQQRDMFDTDVEGVDDSTIAATSILGIDELRPTQPSPAAMAQRPGIDPQPMYQYHQGAHSFDPQWYDNLGDKAMKSAGFSSENGGDDNASQLTSMAGDDEQSEATNESDYFHRRRHADEPLSRRLQSFWNASRKPQAQPDHHQEEQHPEPSKTPAFDRSTSSDPRITSHIPVSTNRKPALPHTMSITPRTRFSPPKPSLLDKLGDRTPTRRSSGPRPQPQPQPSRQQSSMPAPDPSDPGRDEANLGSFSMDFGLNRGSNNPSLTAFDMTNLDGLDNDYSYDEYDPFSRRGSVRRIVDPDNNSNNNNNNNNNPPPSRTQKKRLFEADYPPEELRQKTFDSLQSEPFDHNPAAVRALHPVPESEAPTNASPEDKLAFLSRLSPSDRDAYFSNLTMNEWEDCGDVLVEHFGSLLKKMKDLRHARRKTAAVFEAELKRRHETVEMQSAELSRKLEEMRSGGAEVLRGRTP